MWGLIPVLLLWDRSHVTQSSQPQTCHSEARFLREEPAPAGLKCKRCAMELHAEGFGIIESPLRHCTLRAGGKIGNAHPQGSGAGSSASRGEAFGMTRVPIRGRGKRIANRLLQDAFQKLFGARRAGHAEGEGAHIGLSDQLKCQERAALPFSRNQFRRQRKPFLVPGEMKGIPAWKVLGGAPDGFKLLPERGFAFAQLAIRQTASYRDFVRHCWASLSFLSFRWLPSIDKFQARSSLRPAAILVG